MRKKLMRFNMLIMAIVVLFANVCFASGETNPQTERKVYNLTELGNDFNISSDMISDGNRIYFTSDVDAAYNMSFIISADADNSELSVLNIYQVSGNGSVKVENHAYDGVAGHSKYTYEIFKDNEYYIELTPEQLEILNANPINMSSNNVGEPNGNAKDLDPVPGFFEVIESIFAECVMIMAKQLNAIISGALGRTLTLDNIVFNEYDEIKLDFFEKGVNGETITSNSSVVNILKTPVNTWYGIFRDIALIGYMVILVYIGIKIIMSSTTADKKANYKNTFMHWVTGIAILFFMPYFMKYVILLNEAFVKQVDASRSAASKSASANTTQFDFSGGYLFTNYETLEIDDNATDYMSVVGNLAENTSVDDGTGKLGFAIAYLTLTWQLVMMIIYYYKRVFITAFLIIIFPLIAFTYVWDKLNDGKSQALSHWMQEFSIGVFVQSFHAIVYVFVTNTIYATMTTDSFDIILILTASSFLFAGEEILKQIFGGSGTVAHGSVVQTATRVAAVTTIATGLGKRIITNTVGKDGLVRKTSRALKDGFKYNYLMKQDPTRGNIRNYDKIAINQTAINNIAKLLPESGPISDNIRLLAETVETLNNSTNRRDEDVARAIRNYDYLKKQRDTMSPEDQKVFDAIMSKCKYTPEQLDKLNLAMIGASTAASSGGSYTKIARDLKFEVDVIFSADADSEHKAIANKFYKAALVDMNEHGISKGRTRAEIARGFNSKVEEARHVYENINFANSKKRFTQRREEIIRNEFQNYGTLNREQRVKVDRYVNSVVALENPSLYTPAQLASHRKIVSEVTNDLSDTVVIEREMKQAFNRINANQQSNYDQVDRILQTGQPYRNQDFIDNRQDGLIEQYENKYGKLSDADKAKIEEIAKRTVIAEEITSGRFTDYEVCEAVKWLDENKEEADKLLKLSNIQTDIDTLKYMLAQKLKEDGFAGMERLGDFATLDDTYQAEVMDWATKTINSMEYEASNHKVDADDPVFKIYDILATATNGGENRNVSIEDILSTNASNDAASKIIDEKFNPIRAQNQKEIKFSKLFAKNALAEMEDGPIKTTFKKAIGEEGPIYEEPTYNGYTYDEIKKLRDNAFSNAAVGAMSIASDVIVGTAATFAGATFGAAFTDDGIPIGEATAGAMAGLGATTELSGKVIPRLAGQKGRDKAESKIEEKVKKRIKAEDNSRLKARNAFEEAKNNTKVKADAQLNINMATAKLYITSEGKLSAIVYIDAENAQYLHVDEDFGFPSGNWQPYQESYNYIFKDNDPSKPHDLYIYVRDESGNIKGARIRDAKI